MAKKSPQPEATPVAAPNGKKTTCPITREQFRAGAKPIEVVINGVPMIAQIKEFSTGSLGYYLNGKTVVKVGDVPVSVQIGLNLTVVGSKDVAK